MPGTIQVSVFDFKNISSSSICLWVSMGKIAYQTWDKGDFSFPLTTFRENLVVRLQDAEGNEISRTEVQTLSIVEKGYWDDFFQLEGGDYVHMKLQFILSEDDRNRIRNVRESALKKKQDKDPASNVEYKGTAIPVRDKFVSSLPIRRVFSDRSEANSSSPVKEGIEIQYSEPDRSSAKMLQSRLIHDYISVKPVYEQDEKSVSQKKIFDPSNKTEDQSAQSMLMMDVAAKKEFVSQKKIVDPSNKPEGQSSQTMLKMDVAAKKESISQKKNVDPYDISEGQDPQSILKVDVSSKKESVSQKKIVDSSNEPEDQGVLKKTPSSVRKMISAFETSLTQKKGRRSLTRTRASKSQPNLVVIGGSLKDLDPEDTARSIKMSAPRLERSLNTVDLPEPQINIGKSGFPAPYIVGTEQTVFHEQLKQSSIHIAQFNDTGSSQQETLRSAKKESSTEATSHVYRMRGESSSCEQDSVGSGQPVFHEQLKSSGHIAGSSQQETFGSAKKESNTVAASSVDLMRSSNLETATSSQTTDVAHSDMLNSINLAADQDRLNDPSVAKKGNREIRSETLPLVHCERASNVKAKLISYCKNELYDAEYSGAWIFPDNKKGLCMTTAGKNIVHLSEDCRIGVDDHQCNKRPSTHEITGKRGFFYSMTKKGRDKPQKPRNLSEGSRENGSSGPIRQVIKTALILGFGILVLLTRQSETRRNDRKSKEFYFTSPNFMDQLPSSEEQWSLLTVEED